MKTTTSYENNGVCPDCGDRLAEDKAGRGFVKHRSSSQCNYGRGERDTFFPDSGQLRGGFTDGPPPTGVPPQN